MKVWAVNTPNTFSGMTHTSLFINKEDAEAKYNAFKDRGATIGQVDDIWDFCARNFDEIVMNVIDSFYDEHGCFNPEKETEEGESIDIDRALMGACYDVFGNSDYFNVDTRWGCDCSDRCFIAVSWNCEGENRLFTDVELIYVRKLE